LVKEASMKKVLRVLLITFFGANLLIFYYNLKHMKTESDQPKPQGSQSDNKNENANIDLPPLTIPFDSGTLQLSAQSKAELLNLFNVMSQNPSLKIEVSGHTDNVGDPQKNAELSVKRAKIVADYLVKLGIPSNRITVTGYGQTKPIAENTTEEGKAKNRRVEIKSLRSS
jgi:outer membrane protein OmpA-like peptidoglycan-associated protein